MKRNFYLTVTVKKEDITHYTAYYHYADTNRMVMIDRDWYWNEGYNPAEYDAYWIELAEQVEERHHA